MKRKLSKQSIGKPRSETSVGNAGAEPERPEQQLNKKTREPLPPEWVAELARLADESRRIVKRTRPANLTFNSGAWRHRPLGEPKPIRGNDKET